MVQDAAPSVLPGEKPLTPTTRRVTAGLPAPAIQRLAGRHGQSHGPVMPTPSRSGFMHRGLRPVAEAAAAAVILVVAASLTGPATSRADDSNTRASLDRELLVVASQLEHYRQREGCDPPSVVSGEGWHDALAARYLMRPPRNPLHPDPASLAAGPTLAPGQRLSPPVAWYFDRQQRQLHAVAPDGALLDP